MNTKASQSQGAGIKVLYRAQSDAESDAGSGGSAPASPHAPANGKKQQTAEELHQEKWQAERQRLKDGLRAAKADVRRAEELLARMTRDLGAAKDGKARSDEAFLRALRELQAVREERDEANESANQLLAQVVAIQESRRQLVAQLAAMSPAAGAAQAPLSHALSSLPSSASLCLTGSDNSKDEEPLPGPQMMCSACGSCAIGPAAEVAASGKVAGGGQVTLQASNKKNRNLKQVLKELAALKEAKQQADSQRAGLQEELQRLRREKELAEESSDMVTRQTQVLLQDKLSLVSQIEAKDDLARRLEGGLHALAHQLECAMVDRAGLMAKLSLFDPSLQQGGGSLELGGLVGCEEEYGYGDSGEFRDSEGDELLLRVMSIGQEAELAQRRRTEEEEARRAAGPV